ncbi:GNAT family N-acetyltransferase [Methanococcoides methylutens]|uniref:FemAB-related protein, PEP-CTERM system-associated n=1 Tax=Methanococcoides methylutens MM1 TaxID=1434104 RepID=A0A0E3WZH1_METMT|nr:GNAT family N-acetyltransferase [Methanococcoides methylutens]AKB84290.1 FemAB-related protein, PEP-CTERM system-associated [Methanococcoides methylutens MM1]
MTKIVTKVKDEEWDAFLRNYNTASLYHTHHWKHFLEKTFNYESNYIFAKDECENIVGLLPLFYVKSKLTGNRLCSVPFSHTCGYVGSEYAKNLLIDEGVDLFSRLDSNYFEIRDLVNSSGFCHHILFSTHVLELSSNIDETWLKLHKGTRRGVNKSKSMGVSVHSTKNIEDLKQFYELNCITKKRIGVPCHPWKHFKNMFNLLNEHVSLYIAKYDDEIVAGGIFEYFGDSVTFAYGASNPCHLNKRPNNALIWRCIEDACVNGYKYFDFGRTSDENIGLMNFKRRWGGIEKQLYYSYYPCDTKPFATNRSNIMYKCGTKIVQKTPFPIYKKASDILFVHFG